jgi:hypothetical protein
MRGVINGFWGRSGNVTVLRGACLLIRVESVEVKSVT